MRVQIKNWKLTLLGLFFICLFTYLGCWQLSRAKQKEVLLTTFAERKMTKPITINDLQQNRDLLYYRAKIVGQFDNKHTFLLDNKTFKGQVGYEVYTPFQLKGLSSSILVDRGFVPLGRSREILPTINNIEGEVTLTGLVNTPPKYVAFGTINNSPKITWPLCIEFVNLNELNGFLSQPLLPYILQLKPDDKFSYPIEWKIVIMGPEKHRGYAVQWFAFAITLLILSVALNRQQKTNKSG